MLQSGNHERLRKSEQKGIHYIKYPREEALQELKIILSLVGIVLAEIEIVFITDIVVGHCLHCIYCLIL